MFKYPILFLATFFLVGEANAQVRWRTDYATAYKEAIAKNMPIFVECYMVPCPPCIRMEQTTFQDISVQTILNTHFIPVKMKENDSFFKTNGVGLFPTQLYFRSDGMLMESNVGYIGPQDMFQVLNRLAVKGKLNFNMLR